MNGKQDPKKEREYVTIAVRPQTAALLRHLRDETGMTILSLIDEAVRNLAEEKSRRGRAGLKRMVIDDPTFGS